MMRHSCVVMPPRRVAPSCTARSSTFFGSNRPVVHTNFPPLATPARIADCSPETWNIGELQMLTAGGGGVAGAGFVIASRAPEKKDIWRNDSRLRWVLI